ncbi:MAG: hypothetical protein E6Q71_04125 [Pseudomonas sp.]|nr:MAG: hypothetical protein E6Q71_04125 [Pseudomonas sp.]
MNEKKTARIYDIGTGRLAQPRMAANDDTPAKAGGGVEHEEQPVKGNPVVGFFRHLVFLVLMWLRGPIRFFLGLVGVPAMIAIPIVGLGLESPQKTQIMLALVALSFGAFVLRWLYDSLLIWLSPEPVFFNS